MSGAEHQVVANGFVGLRRALTYIVVGVFVFLGTMAAVFPDLVVVSGRHMVSSVGIVAAAVLRVGVGLALLHIARNSMAPKILLAMGFLLVTVGVALPFLGVENARARVEWEAGHETFLRIEGLLFVWAGYVIYKLAQPLQRS